MLALTNLVGIQSLAFKSAFISSARMRWRPISPQMPFLGQRHGGPDGYVVCRTLLYGPARSLDGCFGDRRSTIATDLDAAPLRGGERRFAAASAALGRSEFASRSCSALAAG
jgi:hypothetical protein